MLFIRASKGLGDAIYLRALVLHLLARQEAVTVFSPYPDVFSDLPVIVRPLGEADRQEGLRHFTYSLDNSAQVDDNFVARCCRAGFEEPVPLRLGWKVRSPALVELVRRLAGSRKILLYQTRKIPRNGSQALLQPNREVYYGYVERNNSYFLIKLGHPAFVETVPSAPYDLDLFGLASIHDVFDIATIADFFFGESCYVPMLGEALGKRFATIFTRRALTSKDRVRNYTPERIIHRKDIGEAVYDESL